MAVLVGVGVVLAGGEARDNSGQLQAMVIIAASTAMASTALLLLYNFDVPSPSGLLSRRGFRPSEGLLGMRHILAGVLEHYVLELTAHFTVNEVD